jgi:hypothetical protein
VIGGESNPPSQANAVEGAEVNCVSDRIRREWQTMRTLFILWNFLGFASDVDRDFPKCDGGLQMKNCIIRAIRYHMRVNVRYVGFYEGSWSLVFVRSLK